MDKNLKSFLNEKAIYLEKQRKKAIILNYVYKVVKPLNSLLNVAFVVLIFINFIAPILIPLLITVGVLALLLSMMNDPKEVYEYRLKNNVLPQIFKTVNPNFNYQPTGYNNKTLQNSELLSKGFFKNTIKIKGEDYINGQINNIDVEFFEITFYKEVVNYAKTAGGCLLSFILIPVEIFKNIFHEDTQSDDVLIGVIKDVNIFYSGFFMYADFHKDFKGKVLMIPKKNERIKDKANEILEPKNLKKISIENPYINDNYNIYSSNPQIGYYVLSQNLIDRIHIISKRENVFPIISLINGKMYFIIPWNKNFFKVDIFSKIENENYFLPYINEIQSFENIIQDLNLDTRIWTKT